MKTWRIVGRRVGPLPADWRDRLAQRLHQRPRRVGAWVELALYGAITCLDAAGEDGLPNDAMLSVSSHHGPDIALRDALLEAQTDLPLPIGFLKSQPGLVLPALANQLNWSGDGRCLTTREDHQALWMAGMHAGEGGLLIGWVDEDAPGRSEWLRLVPCRLPEHLHTAAFPALSNLGIDCVTADAGSFYVGALGDQDDE